MNLTRCAPWLLMAASSLPCAALAADLSDCRAGARFTAAQAQIDAALKTVGDAPGKNRARLESQIRTSAATRTLTQEQQAELLRKAYDSPGYVQLEAQKQPHLSTLMNAVVSSSGPEPRVSKCEAVKEVRSSAWAMADIHSRQYAYVAREVGIVPTKVR